MKAQLHTNKSFRFAFHLFRSLRPRQWVKNLSVGAALIFSGYLFDPIRVSATIQAIVIFCLISSTIYLINDIADRESDRKHPFKRFRPIASGEITPKVATITAIILGTTSLIWAISLSEFFFLAVSFYAGLQLAYTYHLKHLAIIDLFSIAGGFITRVYAGGIILDTHLQIWLLLCVISTAMLIAVGKRRAEIAILTDRAQTNRLVLSKYSNEVLNSYISIFAVASILTWSLFTFSAHSPKIDLAYPGIFDDLPSTISGHNKWLMTTIPLVIYGIMRYIRIIYDGSKAESPERILVTDRPLLITAVAWVFSVIFILYLVILPSNI